MKKTLVFGYGYLGSRVADLAVFSGHQVWATTRSPEKTGSMRYRGIRPLLVDWTRNTTLCQLPEVDQILVAVSYDSGSKLGRHEAQVGGLRNLLAATSPDADVCYISTTGVYHQSDGSWVDETSPTHPQREAAKVHLRAEALLHRLRPQSPWTVLRLAGIYGPGRVPRVADVRRGRPIEASAGSFVNLIHVDDAAAAVMACWERSRRRLYVIGDDRPVKRREFYCEVARQMRVAPPPFLQPPSDGSGGRRQSGNKRVWNRRMKTDLVRRLKFADYRQGLANVLQETAPGPGRPVQAT